MSLSVRIQHHPSRQRQLKLLLQALERSTEAKIVEDSTSSWSGCRKAILSADKSDSHLLILQDDILPAKNLIETAEQLIEILPEFPISLFSASNLTKRAQAIGKRWATTDVWFGMPAYILPIDIAKDFVTWTEEHLKDEIVADDIRMATYLFQHRIKTFLTVPCLVEHLNWRTSTMSERQSTQDNRVASTFIGLEADPTEIDWSEGIDEPLQETVGKWYEFVRRFRNPELCRRK